MPENGPGTSVEIEGMSKWFGDFQVLTDINLTVQEGEKIVVCGPSGSGKSTMIRCINGLEPFQGGTIRVQGIALSQKSKVLDAVRRNVGMVFQQFNLFPHLTVLDNCTLALRWVHKIPRKEADELAMHYLARVRIPEQAGKYPRQLSGGQQQRVAIARSLCVKPTILLCDEPTSSLDPEMVKEVLETLADLANDGITIICVTHEMGFARRIADRVIFMDRGKIVEEAPPLVFFGGPREARTRHFLEQILH
ncbi:amino acid ABC transporter ATP-binding protein [Mesorhizobium sp. BAC0120]|uniref:amino acid ABC transporter ATP-binding protein n=1 Tax=Mesorhizobium sp. BAC0120 TaxID=3090670 RepID=UPI00298C2ACD|nr:amino acid ABC transporter ATP-binding protein [Mesorhizobium sp. BAC0120]MDW6023303.1 amino acid ABC transporter ATP-binding protein [Mesorhizobium sp. BAC0120]